MNSVLCQENHKSQLQDITAQFQLKSQLQSYGLNPDEWRFASFTVTADKANGKAQLNHIRDKNLKIRGNIFREPFSIPWIMKWKWEDLTWDL